jgi:hypothetical protein
MGVYLLSWLIAPAVLVALSLGCGLAVVALTSPPERRWLPGALTIPLGLAVVVLAASLLTTFRATATWAWAPIVLLAAFGFVLGRDELSRWWRERRSALWPLVAGGVPALAIAAPVVLTGKPGFSGFGKIVDLAHQMSFMEHLRTDGRAAIPVALSSFDEQVDKMLNVGYPGGTQAVVSVMASLTHVDVAWVYQPVLAVVAGTLGLCLFVLLRRAIPSTPLRACAAAVAAQPSILYAYAITAGVKELSGAAALALVAAVLARWPADAPLRSLLPGAVALASAYSIFSLTLLPWLGVLVAMLVLWDLTTHPARVRTLARWAALGAGAAALAAPAVVDSLKLATQLTGGGPTGLGNLAAPVPVWSVVGPWITSDHRFPLDRFGRPTLTYIIIAVAIALAVLGIVRAVRIRDRGLLALAVAGAVGVAVVIWKSGPWVELKAFCMTAPVVLALAFTGARGMPRRLIPAGLVAAAVVALGVLYGNALEYHTTTVAPYDRLVELKRLDQRYAGQGPAIYPAFDEYAEYFLRDARGSGMVNPWRSIFPLNPEGIDPTNQGFVRDTDEIDLAYLQGFRLIIRRRDPSASRPPSTFRLVQTTRWFEVWRRDGDPRSIVAHRPLRGTGHRSARFCRSVTREVDKAGPGARVAWVQAPRQVRWTAPPAAVPAYWTRTGKDGEDLFASGPGRLRSKIEVPRAGEYELFMRGSLGRQVSFSLDGHEVGSIRWRESYPDQWEPVGRVRLRAGEHLLQILRGGGLFLPGTGNGPTATTTTIGPLVLRPVGAEPQVQTATGSRAGAICRSDERLDWIEVLRPRAATPSEK